MALPKGRRSNGWLVFAVWMVAAQLSGISYLKELARIPKSTDFKYDFIAAYALGAGESFEALDRPTADAVGVRLGIDRGPTAVGPGQTHPPPAALLVRPLVPLGFRVATWVWFALSWSALFFLAALLLAIWRRSTTLPPPLEVLPLAIGLSLWPPSVFNFSLGQWSLLLATLVAAGWWDLERGATRRSAFWFASAVAIKTTPILLFGYLALRARRVALGAVAAFAAIALLALPFTGGFGAWRVFFVSGLAATRLYESVIANTVSINGVFVRLFLDGPFVRAPFSRPELAHALSTGVAILLVCVALFVTARRQAEPAIAPAEPFAAWACLVALLNPLSWSHNAVLLLLPAVLVARDAERPWVRRAAATAVIMLTVPRQTLYVLAAAGESSIPASRGWILGLHAAAGLILFGAAVAAAGAASSRRSVGP